MDKEFQVGEMVYLRLQPFIQTSLAQRPYQKLAFRYYGPYKIEAHIGAVAYRLALPESSKIHNVVHVSQLKRALGASESADKQLPPSNDVLHALHVPLQVTDQRIVQVPGKAAERVLVQWQDLPPPLSTWEDPEILLIRFPTTPPWGQVGR